MVVAHPSEVPLHVVFSVNYTLRAAALAVTPPSSPLADGKPPVGRTQDTFTYESPVPRVGVACPNAQYTFEKTDCRGALL